MHNDDQLERAINDALSTYIEEPRPGLENRILANVRVAEPRAHWLRWGVALATAACIALAIALSVRTTPKPNTAHNTPAPTPKIAAQLPTQQGRLTIPAPRKHAVHATPRPEALPKLAQFPAPAPLTNDEQQLVAFAQRAKPETVQAVTQAEQRDAAPIEIPQLQIVDLKIPPLSEGGN